MGRWLRNKFLQGDALDTNQQLALGFELLGKAGHAGERFAAAAAFHLDGDHRLALLQNKIHLVVSLAPVGDAEVRAKAGVKQMRADGGLLQPVAQA